MYHLLRCASRRIVGRVVPGRGTKAGARSAQEAATPPPFATARAWRAVWLVHLLLAGWWLWQVPQGFPLLSRACWANQLFPFLLVLTATVAVGASLTDRQGWLSAPGAALAGVWLGGAVASRLLFPTTAQWLWLLPLTAALTLLGLVAVTGGWRPAGVAAGLVGVLLGAATAAAQRAPAAQTSPLDLPPAAVEDLGTERPGMLRLSADAEVDPAAARVTCRVGRVQLAVRPLLTFLDSSPDRCWVGVALAGRSTTPRRLVGWKRRVAGLALAYADAGDSRLSVGPLSAGGVEIAATTTLNADVFSHHNTWCQLRISGHRRLTFVFSPCPQQPIEVLPYRQLRTAYLDQAGRFHVVQSRWDDMGPFRRLARGPLRRDEALTLTVCDEGRPMCRVTFRDWAAQASRDRSRTAGWGLPQNAILFDRLGDDPAAPVSVWLTLASSSLGFGWNSVGHRAGTYANRMSIEPVAAAVR